MIRRKEHLIRLAARCAAAAVAAIALPALAQQVAESPAVAPASEIEPLSLAPVADLTDLTLEDLMNVEVTSVSRHAQRLSDAPAAVYVITADDIRRSGISELPELLRLSPGLQVTRLDASHWAISARGFNDLYSNKLLVLMDGRTMYNPVFSGVFWESVDYVLPDLQQIEVIRGPGATLWGANAVNGVISITTKDARDTQGWLLQGGYGTHVRDASVRYGGKIDDDTFYRVYMKGRGSAPFETPAGGPEAFDEYETYRGGFRVDRHASPDDVLTLQADVYDGLNDQTLSVPHGAPPTFRHFQQDQTHTGGGHVLARWTHKVSSDSDLTAQLYYDQLQHEDALGDYRQNTFDIDVQHRFPIGDRHQVTWGLGYRRLWNRVTGGPNAFHTVHDTVEEDLYSAFVQDDITLVPRRLHLVLGSKFEHNERTGFEVQPSARAVWTPDDHQTVWAAVSRAVRTPSYAEDEGRFVYTRGMTPEGLPLRIDINGARNAGSEQVVAYELGYRVRPTERLTVDAAGFVNVYDDLRTFEQGTPGFNGTEVVLPLTPGNNLEGHSVGVEVAAQWRVRSDWRVTASYTWLDVELHTQDGSTDTTADERAQDSSPEHRFQVRSYYDLTRNLELNASVFYVDHVALGDIPSYVRADLGLVWRPRDGVEAGVWLLNLLDDQHPELGNSATNISTEIPRTLYGQLTLRF